MSQEYKITNIEIKSINSVEYICFEIEQYFHFSPNDDGYIGDYQDGNIILVYFSINDNIHIEQQGIVMRTESDDVEMSTLIVINNNIVRSIVTPGSLTTKSLLYVNIEKKDYITKKVFSEDYRKRLSVGNNRDYILIDLIYTPNPRKIKLNKIKNIIKNNVI